MLEREIGGGQKKEAGCLGDQPSLFAWDCTDFCIEIPTS